MKKHTIEHLGNLIRQNSKKLRKEALLQRSAIQAKLIHEFRQAARKKGANPSYWDISNALRNPPQPSTKAE